MRYYAELIPIKFELTGVKSGLKRLKVDLISYLQGTHQRLLLIIVYQKRGYRDKEEDYWPS